MEVKRVFIQGAGTMGNGIAQVSAQAGYDVMMMDLSAEFVQEGMDAIGKSLQKMVEKGKVKAEDRSAILSRIRPATNIKEAKGADLVIEAVFEDLEVKKKVFKALDEVVLPTPFWRRIHPPFPLRRWPRQRKGQIRFSGFTS